MTFALQNDLHENPVKYIKSNLFIIRTDYV